MRKRKKENIKKVGIKKENNRNDIRIDTKQSTHLLYVKGNHEAYSQTW